LPYRQTLKLLEQLARHESLTAITVTLGESLGRFWAYDDRFGGVPRPLRGNGNRPGQMETFGLREDQSKRSSGGCSGGNLLGEKQIRLMVSDERLPPAYNTTIVEWLREKDREGVPARASLRQYQRAVELKSFVLA
jgi:hypothetical protein